MQCSYLGKSKPQRGQYRRNSLRPFSVSTRAILLSCLVSMSKSSKKVGKEFLRWQVIAQWLYVGGWARFQGYAWMLQVTRVFLSLCWCFLLLHTNTYSCTLHKDSQRWPLHYILSLTITKLNMSYGGNCLTSSYKVSMLYVMLLFFLFIDLYIIFDRILFWQTDISTDTVIFI